jgi:hypothetical protein
MIIISINAAESTWINNITKSDISYILAVVSDEIMATCNIVIIPNLTYCGKSHGVIENVIT